MSRVIHLTIGEREAVARCLTEKVGVSAIERLPQGGIRLVCMSMDGAERMRRKLKTYLIKGEVTRERLSLRRSIGRR